MLPHPIGEVASTDAAGGKIQHQAFLIIYGGVDLSAIEKEKYLHGGVPDALVAIDERMVLDQ